MHKRWQKVVSVLACMVVFCTVYALVLPAVTMEKTAYCGKEEHAHTEACYEDQLICGKAEGEGAHQHDDQCYKTTQTLICTIPESDGHQHTEECCETTTEDILICESEDPEHVHGPECYTTTTVISETPSCGQELGTGEHHHTEECYETQITQICGQEAAEGHEHTEECYKQVFTCEKEEHTHTLACYSDPNADVEDAGVWQNTVASVSLTGNWGEDLAAVAATQNGYRESEANYAVMEDGTTMNGYTRYGAWSGDAYRDNWSAQFVNFCLNYAGIPSSAIAQKPECGQWSTTTVAADGSAYAPKKGDLVILDSDHNGAADHAGVVTNVSTNSFTAVVGDLDKSVKTNTYSTGDSSVVGYVEMPENPALKSEDDADPTPEITPETTPEATPEATPEPEPNEAPEATPTPESTYDNVFEIAEKYNINAVAILKNVDADNENTINDDGIMLLSDEFGGQNASGIEPLSTSASVDFKPFISSVSFEYQKNGTGSWENATNVKLNKNDTVRFGIAYSLPVGTLDGAKEIYYQLPDQLSAFKDSGDVFDNAGNRIGTYKIENGCARITFDEAFAAGNATSELTGGLNLSAKASDIKDDDNKKIEIKFTDQISYEIQFEDDTNINGDISVHKQATSVDSENGTISYTITISSTNGTYGVVSVTDIMENILISGDTSSFTVKDKNGVGVTNISININSDKKGFTTTLPQMSKGDQYTITYTAKLPDDAAYTVTAKNKITAESKRSDNSNIKSEHDISTEFKNKPTKSGKLSEDKNSIEWTIVVNPRKQDIGGWTLTDKLDRIFQQNVTVTIDPPINGQSNITLPYIFPEGTNGTYTITYTTSRSAESAVVKNEAIMEPPSGDTNNETESSGEIGVNVPNSYKKKGIGTNNNGNGTISLKWKATIAMSTAVSSWTWTDSPTGQWFTQDQINELKSTLDNITIAGTSLKNGYTLVTKLCDGETNKYKEVTVTSSISIPAGTTLEFEFSTTADTPTTTQTYYNGMHFNNNYAQGDNKYTPNDASIKKMDYNNENGGDETEHEYHESILNGNGTLKWKIQATVPDRQDITIIEKLPEGVELIELGLLGANGWFNRHILNIDGQNTEITRYDNKTGQNVTSTVSLKRKGNFIEISIPMDLIPDSSLSSEYGWELQNIIYLDVTVKIKNDFTSWTDSENGLKYSRFINYVKLEDSNKNELGVDDQTQKITFDENYNVIKKSADTITNNMIPYKIVINPEAKDLLNGGDTLTLTDVLKYSQWDKFNVTLVRESVKISETKQDGSKVELDSSKDYKYTYVETSDNGNNINTLKFTIPDEKALIIEYKYKVTGETGKWVGSLTNTATLEGVSGNNSSTSTSNSFSIQESAAWADLKGFVIYKVDSENNALFLNGAEFTLFKYEGNTWTKVSDHTSKTNNSQDGMICITGLEKGVAYKLTETKAPTGYELPDNPDYFFYVETEPTSKPDEFVGNKIAANTTMNYPNKKSSSYILPETGGIGTDRLTAVGLSLMAGSLMCEYVLRRRRRERRRS